MRGRGAFRRDKCARRRATQHATTVRVTLDGASLGAAPSRLGGAVVRAVALIDGAMSGPRATSLGAARGAIVEHLGVGPLHNAQSPATLNPLFDLATTRGEVAKLVICYQNLLRCVAVAVAQLTAISIA